MNRQIHIALCVLFVAGITLLKFGGCLALNAQLQCFSTRCNKNETGDMLTIESFTSCGSCTLQVNTTRTNDLRVDIKSIPSWSQSHYLYFINDRIMTGFTLQPSPCSLAFPSYELLIHFKMDGRFTIQEPSQASTDCISTNTMACTDCSQLIKLDSVYKIEFLEQNAFIETKYSHPNIYHWFGEKEIRGRLPKCPYDCACQLLYKEMVVQCNGKMSTTLLNQPGITPLSIQEYLQRPRPPLHVLEASNRQIEKLDRHSFDDLKFVNRLHLDDNLLTHLESGTFGWFQLFMLTIANNKLTDLQEDIFNGLVFLFFLDLHGNELTSLHPNLFQPSRLFLSAIELSRNNLNELNPETFRSLTELRVLIFDDNNISTIEPRTFKDLKYVWWIYLDNNKLTTIIPGTFYGCDHLFRIHLSGNKLTKLHPDMFQGAEVVKELLIARNNITFLQPHIFHNIPDLLLLSINNNQLQQLDLRPFIGLQKLLGLNISDNQIRSIKHEISYEHHLNFSKKLNVSSILPKLKLLNLTNNQIQEIDVKVFEEMPIVEALALRGNPLKRVDKSTFRPLQRNDTYILVDEPATCCFIDEAQCKAQNPRQPYLTCLRLLPYHSLRIFMWIFGIFAFIGNLSVLLWRCIKKGRENIIQVLLIENLATSDLLMGLYMLIIASADAYYKQFFPSESDNWRNGPLCKLAGTISVLSSQGSVFFITLISIDRLLAIKDRGKHRLTKQSATRALICLWVFAFLLSIIPTSISGKNPDFYDVSEVCIGLPFVRASVYLNKTVTALEFDFGDYTSISSAKYDTFVEDYIYPETGSSPGLYYSIVLFLGINFSCFFTVAVSYIWIFILFKKTTAKTKTMRTDQEVSLAIRMGAIVLTDFLCWVPIVIIGILVQSAVITISPVVYVYIVVFILPINSAVNPYIYTIAIIISDYRAKIRSKKKTKPETAHKRAQNKGAKPVSTASSSSNGYQSDRSNQQSTSFTTPQIDESN